MLLPEKHKRQNINRQLRQQGDPKPRILQAGRDAQAEIRKHRPWTNVVRGEAARANRRDGAQDLRRDEGEGDVETGEGVQQDHAEADALEGVEHAEPEPQGAAGDGRADGAAARPRHVQAETRHAPEHLAPARRAEADGEDGQDPRV